MHKAGIGDLLAGAYSSADIGASKPDTKMFTKPLQELGITSGEVIHIGDNLIDDIHGANAAGLYSIWVNLTGHQLSAEDAVPHQEVEHLNDVAGAIQQIEATDNSG